MFIETQITPDENVMNFFPDKPLIRKGHAEFADVKTLRKSPLAEQIFDFGGVVSIFITEEMLSVTKENTASWNDLKPSIMAEIMDYLATGENAMANPAEGDEKDEVVEKILGLLNARIRPAVKQDGGDIVFKKFQDGIVYVEMRGSCVGCPYAMITLKEGVEKVLKTYIPEVKSVENYEE